MANARHDNPLVTGTSGAEGTPQSINVPVGQSRLILETIQPTIKELRDEIAEVSRKADKHLLYLISAFAGGFVLLGTMIVGSYLLLSTTEASDYKLLNTQAQTNSVNLSNQVSAVNDRLIEISTQFSDMQQEKTSSPSRH